MAEDGVDQQRDAREITSLLALPAFWSGQEPAFVIQTLFEALETLLPVEATYGLVRIAPDEHLDLLRVAGSRTEPTDEAWPGGFGRAGGLRPLLGGVKAKENGSDERGQPAGR